MPGATPANWRHLSQAERDAAYDNSAAVPDSPAWRERWSTASASLRARYSQSIDLAYGPRERNKWDLLPGRADAPCLVFIHGGYWQRNSRELFTCMAEGVQAHGWSTALPGYTLAPDATLSEIVAEIGAALDWLADNRERYNIGRQLILSGWSAGGHLTACAHGHPAVTAALAISGVYELAPIRDTNLNERLRLSDQEIATLSPLRLPPVPKPMVVAYGTAELPALVADGRDLHAKRRAAGCSSTLLPVEAANHFTILEQLRSRDGPLTRAALQLASGR